jgi:predicted TIM-barrel fold metal-dependent hydrolase
VTIFDIHPHVVSADHKRYPFNDVFNHKPPWIAERAVDTGQYLAEMDGCGVAKAILVHSSTTYGYDCDYAADSAVAHPDRLGSVCSIDVRAPDAAQRLRYWIRDRKMNGLRIFTAGGTMAENSDWFADPVTYPAWEMAAELGIPICVTMRIGGFPRLAKMVERFSTVRVILDHLCHVPADDGPPFHAADALWAFADSPNVYLKLSTANFNELNRQPGIAQPFVRLCVERFGSGRIAWGSNYPSTAGPLSKLVDLAKNELAFLPEADREAIFSTTALSLYPVLA